MCYIVFQPYPMQLPLMGQAIIFNNVATEMPGSLADAEALQAAYRDVAFDVHSYSDCSVQVSTNVEFYQWTLDNIFAGHVFSGNAKHIFQN